jgi:dipeptidyl aminopeptidase/acylaminoacyl peptidase
VLLGVGAVVALGILPGDPQREAAADPTTSARVESGSPVAELSSPTETTPPAASAQPSGSAEPSRTPAAEVAGPSAGSIVQVLVDEVRVRSDAGTGFEAIGGMRRGERAVATVSTAEAEGYVWTEIVRSPSGLRGWVASTAPDRSAWVSEVTAGSLAYLPANGVAVLDPVTGESVLVTDRAISDVAWSPDGTRLGLTDPWAGLLIIDPSGAGIPAPTPAPAGPIAGPPVTAYPRWSPDGRFVVHVSGQMAFRVYVTPSDGSSSRELEHAPEGPVSWSPDSQRLAMAAFVPGGGVQVATLRPDGPDLQILTYEGGVTPVWSPDGSRIAFVRQAAGESQLIELDLQTASERILYREAVIQSPAWLPDGSAIAFIAAPDAAAARAVWSVTADGTATERFGGDARSFEWSPDGAQVAVASLSASGLEISVAAADGAGVRTLGSGGSPSWQPVLP